jgi:hypothetical protein
VKSIIRIRNLRHKAAESQGWQCYYCQLPMWETDPKIFATRFRVSGRAALLFRCTAEHLEARCDGGRDIQENIVAACQYCNKNRHRKKRPKDATSYASFVRSRIEEGRWHPVMLKNPSDYIAFEKGSPPKVGDKVPGSGVAFGWGHASRREPEGVSACYCRQADLRIIAQVQCNRRR